MQTQPSYIDQIEAVRLFMQIAGQSTGRFDAEQTSKQIGFVCEEVSEMLECVKGGCVDKTGSYFLDRAIFALQALATDFKRGLHTGNVARCDRVELLDCAVDTSWVSMGAMCSMSHNPRGAFEEVARSNFDKFPNGQVTRDAGGKVVKPADWRGPDLAPYVTQVGLNSGFVLNNQGD